MKSRRRVRYHGATKKGFHKGCFGGPTREARKAAREKRIRERYSARRYARNYLRRRIRSGAETYTDSDLSKKKYAARLEYLTQRRLKAIRASSNEKRTSRSSKG